MTEDEVLCKAAYLIEPEGAWTQGAYFRTKNGSMLGNPKSPNIACCCLVGAIAVAGDFKSIHEAEHSHAYRWLCSITSDYPSIFNDNHTQAEVVAALRRAASLADQAGER